ncbi:uncharacterized protein TRUGW13939_05585 [Talaromyces rugulosus]|uniref:Sialidase domain-containing protein n=1 Tax=Talaromyces rugulosus TaxID=121627 RepID=A0A7H8QYG2_TALRU|nr:uncharacterized protein TRUGW13939_05585 [Talaromyces rugulosus]QKX58461.1 hypothetical protein TRUGW13939_05585 [Talaromyces rugulosus]
MAPIRISFAVFSLFSAIVCPFVAAAPNVAKRSGVQVDSNVILMGTNGTYPRATYINNGTLLGCYTANRGTQIAINTVVSTDKGSTWSELGSVANEDEASHGLNNCYLHQLPDSDRILMAFRNHDRVGTHYVKHIMLVYYSDDNGKTWEYLSTVATTDTTGNGIWEPFIMDTLDGDLMLFFSREKVTDGTDQDSSLIRSNDAGKTWQNETTISGADIKKRDGMLGVARLAPGSENLIAVFESLMPNTGITSITSSDDGKTWNPERGTVYESSKPSEAAPQVVLVGETLVTSFATYEDDPSGAQANVKVVTSTDGGVNWGQKTLVQEDCFWAGSVVIDDSSLLVMCQHQSNSDVVARRVTLT